jgi:two-component system, response regulator YesN
MKSKSLFASFFLLSCLIVSSLAIALGLFFSASYERDLLASVRRNDRDMLVQLGNYLSEIVEGSRIVASGLLLDPDILFLSDARPTDPYTVRQRLERLKVKTLAYPFVHSLVVYDHVSGTFYFTLTRKAYDAKGFIDQKLLEGISESKDLVGLLPRTMSLENYFVKINENLLSVVLFRNPSLRDSFIAVNLNAQELGSRLAQVSRGVSSPSNGVYLVDNEGTVIAHSNKSEFGTSLKGQPLFSDILGNTNENGTFIAGSGSKRVVVSFIKRPEGILVKTSLFSQSLASLGAMRLKTLLACAAAIAAFLSLSFGLQRALLGPLRSLSGKAERIVALNPGAARPGDEVAILDKALTETVAHVEELDRFRRESLGQLRGRFLADVANGLVLGEAIAEGAARYSFEGLVPSWYRLAGLRVGAVSDSEGASEALARSGLFAAILPLSGRLVAGLLEVRVGESAAESADRLWPISGEGDWTLGSPRDSMDGIRTAAQELERLSSLWFFRDVEGIITPGDEDAGSHPSYFYPVATEQRILESIRSHRFAEADAQQDRLFDSLVGTSYENAILAITRYATSLFDLIGELESIATFELGLQFSVFIDEVRSAPKLAFAKRLFRELIDSIEGELGTAKGFRAREAADRARAIIDAGYADPNISVKSISESLKLSPAYVGQIFRQVVGKSVPQYLLDLRMQKARSLIEIGQGSITEIALSVGIANARYFYTRYKSAFGITPGQHLRSR